MENQSNENIIHDLEKQQYESDQKIKHLEKTILTLNSKLTDHDKEISRFRNNEIYRSVGCLLFFISIAILFILYYCAKANIIFQGAIH